MEDLDRSLQNSELADPEISVIARIHAMLTGMTREEHQRIFAWIHNRLQHEHEERQAEIKE